VGSGLWTTTDGTVVRAGQPLGYIEMSGGFVQPRMVVRAPADGTVVIADATEGDYVATGTALAVATDLKRVLVTADVDQTVADEVAVGQRIDIAVDAFPATPLVGIVADIQRRTADAAGPLPASSATGKFQKVTQVVPIRITILDQHGLPLVPGMSVEVRIYRS